MSRRPHDRGGGTSRNGNSSWRAGPPSEFPSSQRGGGYFSSPKPNSRRFSDGEDTYGDVPLQTLNEDRRYNPIGAGEETGGIAPAASGLSSLSGLFTLVAIIAFALGVTAMGLSGASWVKITNIDNEINSGNCPKPCADGKNGTQGTNGTIGLNGTCPSNCSGTGTVIGPMTSVDGDVCIFNGTSGVRIEDTGIPSANLVLTTGSQTILGLKTFSSTISLTAASNQIVLQPGAAGTSMTVTMAHPASNRIYTVPDVATDAKFMMGFGLGTNGHLTSYVGTSGDLIMDSGVVALNVVTNPTTSVAGNVATFADASGKVIQDTGTPLSGFVVGPASAVANDLAAYNGVTGKLIKDSGILISLTATVLPGLGGSSNGNVPYFNNTFGHTVLADSGINYFDIATRDNIGEFPNGMAYWEYSGSDPIFGSVLGSTQFNYSQVLTINGTATIGNVPIFSGTFLQADLGFGWLVQDSNVSLANVVSNYNVSAVAGNLPMFNGTTGKIVDDSGLGAATVLYCLTASPTNLNIPIFSGGGIGNGHKIADSGVTINNIFQSAAGTASPGGFLPMYVTAATPFLITSGIAAANVVTNAGTSTTGNIASFGDATGKFVTDSGIAASNVVLLTGTQTISGAKTFSTAPTLTGASNQLIIQPGGSGNVIDITAATPSGGRSYAIPDVGQSGATFILYPNAGPVVNGDVAVFFGTTGSLVADSGVQLSSLVTGPVTSTSGHLASFNGISGKIVQDSGVVAANVLTASTTTPDTSGTMVEFISTASRATRDTGIAVNTVVTSIVANMGLTQVGNLMVWHDTTGTVADYSQFFVSSGDMTLPCINGVFVNRMKFSIQRPVSGTVNGQDAIFQSGGGSIGGSNLNTGTVFLTTGISTGTGRGNVRIQQSVGSVTSGSTDNVVTDRMLFAGRAIISSGVATTVVTPTLAPGAAASFVIRYGITATGGTSDVQAETNTVQIAMVNKAGTFTSTATLVGAAVQALSAGALTTTWSITAAGVIQITSTTTLTSPTMSIVYDVDNMSSSTITFL